MGKLRVYELAKELSMESKEVIRRLSKMGMEAKNHMSTVDDKFADELRQMVKPNPKRTEKAEEEKARPSGNKVDEVKNEVKKGQHFDQQKKNAERRTDMSRRPQNQKNDHEGRTSSAPNNGNHAGPQNKGPYKPNDQNRNSGFKRNQGKQEDGGKPAFVGKSGAQKPADGKGNQTTSSAFSKPGSQKNIQKQTEQNKGKGAPPRTNESGDNFGNKAKFSSQKPGQKNFRTGGKKNQQNRRMKKGHYQKAEIAPAIPKKVVIGESVTVQELAKSMSKTAAELIKLLMGMGVMVTINDEIDSDTAVLIGSEVGIPVEVRVDKTMEIMEDQDDEDDEGLLVERAPVVTVMGHVDHGKTSLLDAIRKAKVTATEAGGITQHIGAYQVEINNKKITFLDTPGHEAFTAMRARGAQVTDVSIIVVAADDGVMPQTIEAINHSKAAKVPIIVAINKIDKPDANPDRVKQELTEHGLVSEEWGGDTVMVPVSAKTHEGIDHLLEMILLVAEVAELKANPDREARGTVIEAELDKGRGPVATVLVQKGTMTIGENIVAGTTFGKVRAMIDDKGRRVKSAGPSTPVVVLGFSDVPPVGEQFVGIKEEKDARYIAEKYQLKKREEELNKSSRVSLDDLFNQISKGVVKDLNLIIKADVQGSIEALAQSLNNLSTDEVRVNIVHSGVGTITETDVMLATTANAVIIGFNVRPDMNIRRIADQEKVDIKLYRVIYEAIDDVKAAMSGLLDPTFKEVIIGHAEVRQVFKVPKVGMVAGCKVLDGKITRQSEVRIIRDGIVVHEGHVESLRRVKDDVKEVLSGFECGIGIENFHDIKEGDVIESFVMEETKREL
ncbi:translation initiation factor IF-2 [Dehalobacterium formicoaceticum]|uniref:translation initiation factor IF-2 n=1 Tax=Dehalobacterium formicoaceticum TaxID=51515 RepID=UPI000B7CB3A0|nr:translation initiation factor IF-2 [Dehalobacterium formicoaceticum]